MTDFVTFVREHADKLLEQTLTHIGLTAVSLFLALLLGVPLGILISRRSRLAGSVLGIAGVLQTVPSVALLGFLIPVLGIGVGPALMALFLYALLPIIRNTYVGIKEVDASVKEAARGIGMTDGQVLTKVELPLALPVIFAGVRTATVINVGVATLAAYVAAGGLGEFIFSGIALSNVNMMLSGAIPAALLAVGFDAALARLQRLSVRKLRVGALVFVLLVPFLSAFYWLSGQQDKLVAGFAHEFYGRADGYPGLQKTYGLTLRPRLIDQNLMYEAIHRGQVDIISGYSTDGRIKAYDLLVLTDNRYAFPPYDAAPVIRQTTLNRFPALGQILNRLAGQLTDSVMTALNYQVDYQKQSTEAVARNFLNQIGLFKPPQPGERDETVVMGSKVFTEQYILAEMYRQLIEGHTQLRVVTKTGLGGTQICFDALRTGAIDFYPEYTGTGLLVVLQPSASVLDHLPMQSDTIYQYVRQQFQQQYQLDWLRPLGFNNSYCLMMRREQANQLGIKTIEDLVDYLANK
ncbi:MULTISPECIES: ABC transporter permease/substrate-binding protein [unclassified Spirosoma]|uniref:ABC transporter permease/substrate-binding protein n=1 Tax=unclassified Spirosoma TaxID=2621999 RepID=UPI00095EA1D3|nr:MULTISPECIES: ABC transporter permease/substrate-binding protein [unclassified Spirosoma]MBN8821764.1 ABC transporter permease/substrate-binding protein [Spirosoma sp.]OJW80744.1 MAG: ABC transporter permease [Spirosoma sp. 48-14]